MPFPISPLALPRLSTFTLTVVGGLPTTSLFLVPSTWKVWATYFQSAGSTRLSPAACQTGNPYGAKCYGLKPPQMVDWIRDFSRTYHAKTSRYPVIYTSTSWWSDCTGSSGDFGSTSPLWIARWSSSVGPLPHGWSGWTFWQYANSGPDPGDQDRFNGDLAGLKK